MTSSQKGRNLHELSVREQCVNRQHMVKGVLPGERYKMYTNVVALNKYSNNNLILKETLQRTFLLFIK